MSKKIISRCASIVLVVSALFCLSSCQSPRKTDQELIADIVQEQFSDIYDLGIDHSMSLTEAETILWCWADENSGVAISEDDLREAIWAVLEGHEDIRHLIYRIDELNLDDYR